MNLRVTPTQFITQAVAASQTHSRSLATLQQQAATGLRLQRPSDDPAAWRTVLSGKAAAQRLDTELANLRDARQRLDFSVSNLLEANTLLSRVKQIAMDGQQALDPVERQTLAAEVDRLLERLVAIGNTETTGQYLFGGQMSDTAPFKMVHDGEARTVEYLGGTQRATIATSAGTLTDAFYTGEEIFLSGSRGPTVVLGQTGAAPGAAADSGIGTKPLLVQHTATAYAAGSGVQPGTSSPGGDMIIGPAGAHTLTVVDTSGTGAFGTISLNGGPAVSFTNSDTNLLVPGATGERVYVDTTAITAGFSNSVDITANGTLSIDGGATSVAIDFTNQQLVDSKTGQVANIDSTQIRRSGTDSIEFSGTAGLFGTLLELRDDLLNGRDLSPQALSDSLGRRLADLDRHQDNLLRIVGDQSATLESLDMMEQRTQQWQLHLADVVSEHESADMIDVVLQLQEAQNLLQYTFAATARMFDLSLLNFLR